jgi:hypothetical protein
MFIPESFRGLVSTNSGGIIPFKRIENVKGCEVVGRCRPRLISGSSRTRDVVYPRLGSLLTHILCYDFVLGSFANKFHIREEEASGRETRHRQIYNWKFARGGGGPRKKIKISRVAVIVWWAPESGRYEIITAAPLCTV